MPAYRSPWGVLVLLKFYWAPDIVEFVLGRFSHFNIAIAYSNSTFCGAWTPSFCEFTQNFSKTSTLPEQCLLCNDYRGPRLNNTLQVVQMIPTNATVSKDSDMTF